MEEYIVSFIDGRVRLRHPILENTELGSEVSAFIRTIPGIEKVEHKALTGSLLIIYDPEQLHEEELTGLLAQGGEWLKENAPEHAVAQEQVEKGSCIHFTLPSLGKAERRMLLKRGLAISMITTVASLAISSRVHVIAGGVLALLALQHAWQRRRAL